MIGELRRFVYPAGFKLHPELRAVSGTIVHVERKMPAAESKRQPGSIMLYEFAAKDGFVGEAFESELVPLTAAANGMPTSDMPQVTGGLLAVVERLVIMHVLANTKTNAEAIKILGVGERTLSTRRHKYGLSARQKPKAPRQEDIEIVAAFIKTVPGLATKCGG